MTVKQQIHDLVEALPDDSPLLLEVRETLRMNRALAEAMDDIREKTLKIGLSGAGAVEYIGNPKVTQQISGAGRVKRRDASDAAHIVA